MGGCLNIDVLLLPVDRHTCLLERCEARLMVKSVGDTTCLKGDALVLGTRKSDCPLQQAHHGRLAILR